MTYGYRYDIEHRIHGWESNATNKKAAFAEATKLAAEKDSEYVVIDKLAHHGEVQKWTVASDGTIQILKKREF